MSGLNRLLNPPDNRGRREILNCYDFTDEWRMEPCLWNDKAEGYRDKSARESALQRLADKFNMNGRLVGYSQIV